LPAARVRLRVRFRSTSTMTPCESCNGSGAGVRHGVSRPRRCTTCGGLGKRLAVGDVVRTHYHPSVTVTEVLDIPDAVVAPRLQYRVDVGKGWIATVWPSDIILVNEAASVDTAEVDHAYDRAVAEGFELDGGA